MAAKTLYSHAYIVGCLNAQIHPDDLDTSSWRPVLLTSEEYVARRGAYYKSHVDAMLEAEGQERPKFLQSVRHFCHEVAPERQEVVLSRSVRRGEETILQVLEGYHLHVCAFHLYFFPFDIVLVALEIDDSASELNDLTMAHWWLTNWTQTFPGFADSRWLELLEPLRALLPNGNLAALVEEGNNLKIYQIIQLPEDDQTEADEALLYELGTFSPIGCVRTDMRQSPSEDYFNNIVQQNVVSAFKNWRALSLVDSFTVLSASSSFGYWPWQHLYFPLIYLRCVFEKTFCASRNSAYRLDKAQPNLVGEISQMEKYYFYKNISFNFLPSMLYESMADGIGIDAEREELSQQVKEQEEKQSNLMLTVISVFAVFSVVCDFYSTVMAASGGNEMPWLARILLTVSAVIILFFVRHLSRHRA